MLRRLNYVPARVAALAAGVLLALPACDSSPSEPDVWPNLVLLTLDTTRADHLPTYGYFRATTPALDELAAESLVFERCIAPMATTLPTHLSMLTGTYPLEHGVMSNSTTGGEQYIIAESLRSLALVLADAGYRTGGFVSGAPLSRGTGAARGYDAFGQPAGMDRHSEQTVDEALAWLAADQARPFHLWVHFFDAHWPFHPPAEYRDHFATDEALEAYISERGIHTDSLRPMVSQREDSRTTINAYDSALRYQDAQFARVLEALRARTDWDRTVVVVIGDHGEGLGQHGVAAHGDVWDEQLRVPLVVRIPGEVPRRISETLSTVDVMPTVLARLELPFALDFLEQASGRNALDGAARRMPVFSQETGRGSERSSYRFSLTDDRWKYMRVEHTDGRVTDELFDLQADPFELHDVAAERPKVAAQFRQALVQLRNRQGARARTLHVNGKAQTRPIDEEAQRKLRALGYTDGDKRE